MRAPRWPAALGLALLAASAAVAADRLDGFPDLARRFAGTADPAAQAEAAAEIAQMVDAEILESLRAGGPFASAAFIQGRLDALGDEWGGADFRIVQVPGASGDGLTLGLLTLTRDQPWGSLRIYGAGPAAALLGSSSHDGGPELRAWRQPRGAHAEWLATWVGPPDGRGSRRLTIELWRQSGPATVARTWSSESAFPDGLQASDWRVGDGMLRLRYETRYPGWQPGCADQTEREDVWATSARTAGLSLQNRRVLNGWHRELHAAVDRLFAALDASDREVLTALVPDPALRARLPRALRADPVCDVRPPDAPGTVVVGATRVEGDRLAPWSLAWRRGPRGWRLTAATPVLQ